MEDASLIYDITVNKIKTAVNIPIYAELTDIYGKEFYMSYQSGVNIQIAFKINKYDFYESEHNEADTGTLKYASMISYRGATYKIIRYQNSDEDKILLICG